MACQYHFERCRKHGVILTCFIDGRKRFRTAPVVGLRDESTLLHEDPEPRDGRAGAFQPFVMPDSAD
ncbi:MAG: hypothetical protein O7F76_06135 [Planctomycetota bacterium]|nr:hypothetical protein [Planctomycetota bacterium]MCZ6698357.1 hypothetical protein [Planctomycetota bacterium]MCZ6816264.1 hypothetical protein [Planctomycetota bacterium]